MTNHLQEKAVTRNLPPKSDQKIAVLAVHGRNQEPDYILNICDRLGWNHHATIAPKAANKTWYPGGFMTPV
ncbi:MAG: hypothetical protein WD357_05065 [Gracilimonas sp.]